jgi:glycosyltransferase involved in cell wall biosynthesis
MVNSISSSATIITPVLNGASTIATTLKSVGMQGESVREHLIIDGGSEDETEVLVKNAGGVARFTRCPGMNQAAAVNEGIRLAKGSFIGWLNADDFYFDRWVVGAVADCFGSDASARVIYGDCVYIDGTGRITDLRVTPPFNRDRLSRYSYLPQPAVFVRCDLAKSVPLNTAYEFVMDSDWFLRLASLCDFRHIRRFVAVFREHPGQKMHKLGRSVYTAEVDAIRGLSSGRIRRHERVMDMMTNLRARLAGRMRRLRIGPGAFEDLRLMIKSEGDSKPCA